MLNIRDQAEQLLTATEQPAVVEFGKSIINSIAAGYADRPKTLPQYRELFGKLAAIEAPLQEEVPHVPTPASVKAVIAQKNALNATGARPGLETAQHLAAGIEIPKAPPTDQQLLATYTSLAGAQRKQFLMIHNEALWRATRKASRAKMHRD